MTRRPQTKVVTNHNRLTNEWTISLCHNHRIWISVWHNSHFSSKEIGIIRIGRPVMKDALRMFWIKQWTITRLFDSSVTDRLRGGGLAPKPPGNFAYGGVPVYFPAFAGTYCAYPRRDGQAELTWVAGYIPRWFTRPQTLTHPSTNRTRRRVTSLIETNALPLSQTATISFKMSV